MKKGLNVFLVIIMVLTIVFHFLVTQTDYISKLFGTNLNQKQVMVAAKVINKGEELTPNNVTLKYIDTQLLLRNPANKDDKSFALTNLEELEEGFVAAQTIVPGEQIVKSKLESKAEASNPKQLMYAITVDYLSTVGSSLYAGDKPILWHSWNEGSGNDKIKFTEKVFNVPVEILQLKDGNGNIINADRSQPAVIPSVAIIRVDEDDVKELEKCMSLDGNKFFFVKEVRDHQ